MTNKLWEMRILEKEILLMYNEHLYEKNFNIELKDIIILTIIRNEMKISVFILGTH